MKNSVTSIAEEAVDSAEFSKYYKIWRYGSQLLEELHIFPEDNETFGRDLRVKLVLATGFAEDIVYDWFCKLDIDGNYEFDEFIEAVKEQIES